MKVTSTALSVLVIAYGASAFSIPARASATDWSQPPVACAEEVVPSLPDRPCPDLSGLADVELDWPQMSPTELAYWQNHPSQTLYCRGKEVLRREQVQPGTYTSSELEISWMESIAVDQSDQKTAAIYEASRLNRLPTQILVGAVMQESMFADLGIGTDGGNYSCGIGQGNILEWCDWANVQSPQVRLEIGWPKSGVDCSLLTPAIVKPFYDIALTKLGGLPEFKMSAEQFQGIQYSDVVQAFPAASDAVQKIRFQLAMSFINHCADPVYGISAKARELSLLYKQFVPAGLKKQGMYAPGDQFKRQCQDEGYQGAYPLNLGWLLAVGVYNAGPRAVDAVAYYYGWTAAQLKDPATWDGLEPADLVKAIYWAGRYNSQTDLIDFTLIDGAATSWIWFKPCVLQRHLARVVQHVTLPGQADLVDSLEGEYGCAKSTFDPVTGALVQSSVPPGRQVSSGRE